MECNFAYNSLQIIEEIQMDLIDWAMRGQMIFKNGIEMMIRLELMYSKWWDQK